MKSNAKDTATMTTLTTAQAELDRAQERERSARVALSTAEADAATKRQQVAHGNTKVTAADLAAADATIEYARLVLQGASEPLAALGVAVQLARLDQAADEVVVGLPVLGSDLIEALSNLESSALALVQPIRAYDTFATAAVHQLETLWSPALTAPDGGFAPPPPLRGATTTTFGAAPPAEAAPLINPATARVKLGRHSTPTVDRMPIAPCRGPAQLALAVLPAFTALGASPTVLDGLKLLASGAPTIPTV
jgi:hypothetical protein